MSDTGTPSKTDIRSKSWRLQSLFGPPYAIYIEWGDEYKITVRKGEQRADFTMTNEDFKYRDDQLLDKFINPAKGVFK